VVFYWLVKMKVINTILVYLFLVAACSSMSVTERETKRSQLDEMAATAIAGLVEQDAALQQKIDESLGYAVANMKVTKVPIVGAGGGEGVFVDNKTNKRTYFTVSRFDIGGGWGARSYKILLVFETQEMMDRLDNGTWEFQAGVEASAGTAAAEGSSGALNEGYTVHVLSDGGASATATARVIRIKVNSELTDNQ
jgi:lipid-binding SYLF domain-containing protein